MSSAITSYQSRFFNLFSVFLLFFFLASPFSAEHVEADNKYPPYPAVWGYELGYPDEDRYYGSLRAAKLDDGEVYITFGKKRSHSETKNGANFGLISFFSRKLSNLSDEQYNGFWKENQKREVSSVNRITFNDGSSVSLAGTGGGGRCYSPLAYAIAARDNSNNITSEKSLIYLLNEPRIVEYGARCIDATGKVLERVQTQPLKLVPLEDDTFIVYEENGNVILRLDKNLETRYSIGKNVFLVDRSVIERLRREAQVESGGNVRDFHQKLNDKVASHLTSKGGEQ